MVKKEIKILLDEESAQILYWSIANDVWSETIPSSSHTGIVWSNILQQLIEQGIE